MLKRMAFAKHERAVIVLLLLVNILNFIDRQLPYILVDAIKNDLHLSDAQIGLMAGVVFAVVYSLATIVLAQMADRFSARWVIVVALSFWSLATALSGVAQNFSQLIAVRSAVAAGEAGSTPSGHAVIARAISVERRGLALALFSLGVPIGSMLGLMLGGWINDAMGWREAFFVVGLPGVIVAFLSWRMLPETQPRTAVRPKPHRLADTLRHLFALRSFTHMTAASTLFAIGAYAMNVFAPAFLMRTYAMDSAEAGAALGLASGIGGLIGTFVGGVLADSLGRRDPRWRQLIPALGLALCVPTALGAWLAPNGVVSVGLLTLVNLLGLLYFAPTFAAVQMLVPDEIRATAAAVLLFALTLIGSSVGPYVIGWVSDMLTPTFGSLSLRYALCLLAVTMAWSAWHFFLAARALPHDLAQRGT